MDLDKNSSFFKLSSYMFHKTINLGSS